ncbi:MAG: hypothetical protein AAFR51_05670 [Pseudomonadota bacterium]
MRRAKGLIAALAVAVGGMLGAVAEEKTFYTVRADPTLASENVAASSNPQIAEQDFWTAAEPLVKSEGYCKNAGDPGPVRVTEMNFDTIFVAMIERAMANAMPWFEEEGFYPFGSTTLDVRDPKAPAGIPVFCTLNASAASKWDGRLRAGFFDFDAQFEQPSRAVIWAQRPLSDKERTEYQRVFYSAARIMAEMWEFGVRAGRQNPEPPPSWLGQAVLDAMAIAALEPRGRLDFDNYDDIEMRLPFLQGNYADRLNIFLQDETQSGFDESRGALIRFLIEDHIDKGWNKVDGLLESTINEPDTMDALNRFVDANDGELYRGLQHAIPSFMAHQASLVYDTYQGKVKPETWLEDSFGECPEVKVDEVVRSQTRTVEILPYAARCFIVRFEANHAGWTGEAQVRTKVSGGQAGDDRVGDIFFSGAAMGNDDLNRPIATCAELIEADDVLRCLMVPSTPPSRDEEGVLQSFYNTPLERESPDDKRWTIFLVSYVPTDTRPGGVESRPGVNIELTWSLDAVIGEPGDLADMGDGAPGGFELMDMSTATVDHGSKVGLAPISTSGKTPDYSWTNIFEGMASPVSDEIIQGAGATMDMMLSIVDATGDGFGYIVTDPNVLAPGFTGKTDAVIPFVGKDGYVGIPDDDYDGAIEIIENTRDTLYFTADEGFCMVPADELPKMIAQNISDFCEYGERITAKAKGTLAFPPTRRSDTALEPQETETYRGLVELRMAAINSRFGGALSPISNPASPGQNGSAPSSGGDDTLIVGGTPRPGSCSIRSADGACDCSCTAKLCFAEKQASGTLLPQESSCRLSCGKKWNQCAP